KYETNTKQTFEQKGVTLAITSPVISAIQAVQGVVQSTRQVGESKHGRVNAMAAANAGFDAYRAAQSVGQAANDVGKFMSNTGNVDSVIGAQITYGQQKNESRTHTEGKTAAKSQVNADGKVNIVATGAGKDSNINIEGSDISGKQGTTLMADNQVNIKAAEQNHQERSTNKSRGFNAGAAIKVSNGEAAGVTLGGNHGKGDGNGDETTYVASHVGDSQSKTDVTTDNAEQHSGKLENHFDKDKVMKELNIQVKVTQDFRKNAFSIIDAYVLPKQDELRKQIKEAKTEEEKTALYGEIYKLQYQKRLLETVVGIVSGSPDVAITQGTLQLAATKMREETLANSRLFKGIKDAKTGKILRNDSYDSGYFDGVKLGGVRIDINAICTQGVGSCEKNADGLVVFKGENGLSLDDAIDPNKNQKAKDLYGPTGGFQSVEGGWYSDGKVITPYKPGNISDHLVESFAGTHDLLGGQMWGWYDKQGNTSQKNNIQQFLSDRTTEIAIPISAPFAVSDLISSDMMEVLFKLGGN
uniref:hemagglutinin repeat-containing protein n=1 Tax=Haemophilus parainfluenzae TaxID=729 RepID=UPI00066BFC36